MSVYDEIRTGRQRHASNGYDAAHDRMHGGLAHLIAWANRYGWDAIDAKADRRRNLVKAASMLVAAIELMDSEEQ